MQFTWSNYAEWETEKKRLESAINQLLVDPNNSDWIAPFIERLNQLDQNVQGYFYSDLYSDDQTMLAKSIIYEHTHLNSLINTWQGPSSHLLAQIPQELLPNMCRFLPTRALGRLRRVYASHILEQEINRELINRLLTLHLVPGYSHTVLHNQKQLFRWGNNYSGQLADGRRGSGREVSRPQLWSGMQPRPWPFENITVLAAGIDRIMTINNPAPNRQECVMFGHHSNHVGDPVVNTLPALPTRALIVQLSLTKDEVFAISIDGNLYSHDLGANHYTVHRPWQLGPIAPSGHFTQVATGFEHVLILSSNNHLYHLNGHQLMAVDFELPPGINIKQIVAGQNHNIMLLENGQLFTWGNNIHGQLGLGHLNVNGVSIPQLVSNLPPVSFIANSAGSHHTLVVTQDGKLYAWGKNDYAQLGMGQRSGIQATPQLVQILPANLCVAQAITGEDYCMIMSTEGKVYEWGRVEGRYSPVRRRNPAGIVATDYSAVLKPVDLRGVLPHLAI